MLDLLRLIPRRPLAVSIAGWIFFFVVQIGWLTFAANEKYVPPAEPGAYDRVWFIYTELPRALPMAAVYAVCLVFVGQVMGRFIATDNPDNLTVGRWVESLRETPIKAIVWMGLRLVLVVGVVVLALRLILPLPPLLTGIAWLLVALLLFPVVVSSWFNWAVAALGQRNGSEARPESAIILAPTHLRYYRRRRRSRGRDTPSSSNEPQ